MATQRKKSITLDGTKIEYDVCTFGQTEYVSLEDHISIIQEYKTIEAWFDRLKITVCKQEETIDQWKKEYEELDKKYKTKEKECQKHAQLAKRAPEELKTSSAVPKYIDDHRKKTVKIFKEHKETLEKLKEDMRLLFEKKIKKLEQEKSKVI
ncbi:hypothetical protein ADUPG1_006993 [Aduncisulcus paluster]|uniref:Uncharacterized protein n=1 Tax=Aduncisulcus paluster TaxID=2918883 RepID=A0ABQ5KLY5_9EUKA|nr:hypothetical protein ADUPG1_006993 [Aduncisulcus paluster]